MKKAVAIELVWIWVNGGKLSHDSNVKYADVEAYFDFAMGAAIRTGVFEGLASERGFSADGAIPPPYGAISQIYTPVSFTPTLDSESGLYTASLPKLLSLQNDWAIERVETIRGDLLSRLRSPAGFGTLKRYMLSKAFYWVEYGETPVLYFRNLSLPVCPLRALVAKAVSSFSDDDELPFSDQLIYAAVEGCKQHFQGQRSMPADDIYDNKDVNEQRQ